MSSAPCRAQSVDGGLSDAVVALPGGFGTLEEFCEVVTWTQLGLHAKPCGILNVQGYYSPLLAMFDHAVNEGFLKPENRPLVLAGESPADLLQAMEEWRPIHVEKWLSRETRGESSCYYFVTFFGYNPACFGCCGLR
jgi:hypothetical protein